MKALSRLKNWKTTGSGLVIAIFQVVNELSNDKEFDWKIYAVAVAVVLLGAFAGDEDTKKG